MWCGKKKIFLNIKIFSTKPTLYPTASTKERIIPYLLLVNVWCVSKVQFSVSIRVIFMNSVFALLPFNTPTLHLKQFQCIHSLYASIHDVFYFHINM